MQPETYGLTAQETQNIDHMNTDELRAEIIRTGKELENRASGIYAEPETNEKLTDKYDYASDRLANWNPALQPGA